MKAAKPSKPLPPNDSAALVDLLKTRFEQNMRRHPGLNWEKIRTRLEARPQKLRALSEMERTDGEPDVIGHDPKTGEYLFADCSAQSPEARASLCYDREALDARKKFPPKGCATELAEGIGIELLNEEQYHELQKLGEFDTKSSSWLKTPPEIRKLGGAIFGDRRFGRVFIYHNGADSYYSGRGFRGMLRV